MSHPCRPHRRPIHRPVTRGQRPDERLLQLRAMKDKRRNRRRKRPSGIAPEISANRPLSSYTPEQREKIWRGLRILARMIIRAHMRRLASQVQAEHDGGSEDG